MTTPKPILFAVLFALTPMTAAAGPESAVAGAMSSFRQLLSTPIKTIVADLSSVRAFSDEDRLLDLLDDSSPAVRAQAAKSLRHYALNSYRVESKLLNTADDSREKPEVRREAIKSLAWAAQHYNTKSQLLSIATDRSEPEDLRSIAFKSLYVVANSQYDVRSALQSALSQDSEPLAVRKGAAWTLWADSQDYSSRRALLGALDSSEPMGLRVEAAKSLFVQMHEYDVKNRLLDYARDTSTPEALREAAVLCLLQVNRDYSVRSFLENTAQRDANQIVRLAAVKALDQGISLELVRYFHLSFYQGRFIDPLEDQ